MIELTRKRVYLFTGAAVLLGLLIVAQNLNSVTYDTYSIEDGVREKEEEQKKIREEKARALAEQGAREAAEAEGGMTVSMLLDATGFVDLLIPMTIAVIIIGFLMSFFRMMGRSF